jgi:cardiolipin synthase
MERARERGVVMREAAAERAERARMTTRRLFGIDRSGPPPPETLAGHPLHPWTIPNAIGFVRLGLIPVFLVYGLGSGDGSSAAAATLFAVIAWTDYLDGMAARITGQYSRLGALLDPVVDRLLVVSGIVVCWHFELLPRWALALLVARELFMLVAGRLALQRGADLRINWPGRIGVWPVMSAVFFALASVDTLDEVLLYIGMFFTAWATVLYVRDARRQIAAARALPPSS